MNVCHLTSVHPAYDTRILLRECMALKDAGHDVTLIAPAARDSQHNGVRILAVRKQTSRMKRMLITTYDVMRKATAVNADVYHYHDPELMWVGWWLKRSGKKVVYDVHENVPRQILQKKWLVFPRLASRVYRWMESLFLPGVNVVTAAASNLAPYSNRFRHCIDIENYPDTEALSGFAMPDRSGNPPHVIYVGSVSFDRGIDTMVRATRRLIDVVPDFRFHCVGPMEPSVLHAVQAMPEYDAVRDNIIFHGSLPQDRAYAVSLSCRVGWCVLKPTPNYLKTYSTKIFEYMAIALPSIASDFDINKPVLEDNKAGLCVPPSDDKALAEATQRLFNDPVLSSAMGTNGVAAVKKQYNWKVESQKLIEFYKHLI